MEKAKEYQQTLYIELDFNKAFNSMEHSFIYEALYESKVETKYINVIKEIYTNSTAKVKLEKCGKKSSYKGE